MGTCQSNTTIINKAAADSSCSTSSTAATSSTVSTNPARMKSEKKAKNIAGDLSTNAPKNHGSTKTSPKGQLTSANNNIKIYSFVSGLEIVIEEIKRNGDFKTKVVHFEGSSGKSIEEVYSGAHDGPILGTGISGVVRLATHKATGVKYAVKCLDLGLIGTADGLKQIREEIHIMCQLDHPNIVRLEEVYEGNNEIFLVQELCSGGELFDRLDDQPDCHFTEKQCVGLVKQMLSAVRYMHSNGIVHRDLKLENFLFSTASPDSELKMIDFGLSKHFTRGQKNQEPVGTPYTVAPEVLRGNYDEKVDVWAIGVITYLLLCGDAPFGGCGGPEPMVIVRKNILEGSFRFEPEDIWKNVTPKAKQFISSLLVTNPKARPSAEEAQQLEWLQDRTGNSLFHPNKGNVSPDVVEALMRFKKCNEMHKLLCEVLSFTLLPHQIEDLRKEFKKIDEEGRGEITLPALKKILLVQSPKVSPRSSVSSLTESSLRISERDVEDIFKAMRIKKTNSAVQWHEFLAAALSQCTDVNDCNLRLAFDRLDCDHKGYVTLDDVLNLVETNSGGASEKSIRAIFQDTLKLLCRCRNSSMKRSQDDVISYEDFLQLASSFDICRKRHIVKTLSSISNLAIETVI